MKLITKFNGFISFGLILIILNINPAFAQNGQLNSEDQAAIEGIKNKPLNGFFGFSFTNVVPQGKFMDSIETSGQGFSIYGGYDMDPVPVSFGLEADFLFFGGETRYFTYGPGGWNIMRDTVETQRMIIPINLFVRLQPNVMNYVYPYLEGIAGFSMLSVDATINAHGGESDNRNRFSAAWNYGFGAGAMIKLVDFVQLPNSHSQLLLEIKGRYLKGSETEFSTVKIKDDSDTVFNDYKTTTDVVTLLIGLTFRF